MVLVWAAPALALAPVVPWAAVGAREHYAALISRNNAKLKLYDGRARCRAVREKPASLVCYSALAAVLSHAIEREILAYC